MTTEIKYGNVKSLCKTRVGGNGERYGNSFGEHLVKIQVREIKRNNFVYISKCINRN